MNSKISKIMFTMSVYVRNKGKHLVSQIDWERGSLSIYISDAQDEKQTVRFIDIISFQIEYDGYISFFPQEKFNGQISFMPRERFKW